MNERIDIRRTGQETPPTLKDVDLAALISDEVWTSAVTLLRTESNRSEMRQAVTLYAALKTLDSQRLEEAIKPAPIFNWDNILANNAAMLGRFNEIGPIHNTRNVPDNWRYFVNFLKGLRRIDAAAFNHSMHTPANNAWLDTYPTLEHDLSKYCDEWDQAPIDVGLMLAHANMTLDTTRAVFTRYKSLVEKQSYLSDRLVLFAAGQMERIESDFEQGYLIPIHFESLLFIKECLPEIFEQKIHPTQHWKRFEQLISSQIRDLIDSHTSVMLSGVFNSLAILKRLFPEGIRIQATTPQSELPTQRSY